MSDLLVRPEGPGEAEAIAAVVTAAFGGAGEAALIDALRRAGALALSLVAVERQEVVGHVALSALSVQGAFMPGVLALAPLAVAPGRQRQGIGRHLVEAAIAAARADGGKVILVLGDPAYYGRFGFRPAAAIGLTPPWKAPAEAFQALTLASPWPRGLVRYHRAFATVGA